MNNRKQPKKHLYRSSIVGLCSTAILLSSTAVPVFGAVKAETIPVAQVSREGALVPEVREVTRTISYLNPVTKKQESVRQVIRYRQDGDQATALASPVWPEFFSPEFAGFETDQVVVQAIQTDAQTADSTVTINYYPRKESGRRRISIHFNSTPATASRFAGDQQVLKTIRTMTDDNGDLLIPAPPEGWRYFNPDLPPKVHFGQGGLASLNLYVCPLATVSREQTKDFQRELILHLPTGDQRLIQTATAKRVIVTENGVERPGKWTVANFPALRVPTVLGYAPSQAVVPELQPAADQTDLKVEIYYYQTQNNNSQTENTTTDADTQTTPVGTTETGTQTALPQTQNEESQTETAGTADSATQTTDEGMADQGTQTNLSSDEGTQTADNPSTTEGVQTGDGKLVDEAGQTEDSHQTEAGTQTNNQGTSAATPTTDGSTQTSRPGSGAGSADAAAQTSGGEISGNSHGTQTEDTATTDTATQTDSTQRADSAIQTEKEKNDRADGDLVDCGVQTSSQTTNDDAADIGRDNQAVQTELPSREEADIQTKPGHGEDQGSQTDTKTTESGTQTDLVSMEDSQPQTTVPATVEQSTQTGAGTKKPSQESQADNGQAASRPGNLGPAINENNPRQTEPIPAAAPAEGALLQPQQPASPEDEVDPLAFHNALAGLEQPLRELGQEEKDDQLPQTGNQASTKTTIIGLLVTLLAGLASLWTLKKRH